MRKSKFTNQEIHLALGKLEKGTPMEEICKKMGVTVATVYNWKKKFNTHEEPQVSKGIKELEEENKQLRQNVENLSLEKLDLLNAIKRKVD